MLGWWITVWSLTPEERNRAETDARNAATMAQWEIGPGGLDWLDQLVQEGKATQLSVSGYPNRYTARADDVLPLLANWRGDIERRAYRMIEWHADLMAACPAEQVLTIDAWDQS